MQIAGKGQRMVARVAFAAWKDISAGHEDVGAAALAHQHPCRRAGSVEQNEGGGIARTKWGAFRFRLGGMQGHVQDPRASVRGAVYLYLRFFPVEAMHAQRPLQTDDAALDGLQRQKRGQNCDWYPDGEMSPHGNV